MWPKPSKLAIQTPSGHPRRVVLDAVHVAGAQLPVRIVVPAGQGVMNAGDIAGSPTVQSMMLIISLMLPMRQSLYPPGLALLTSSIQSQIVSWVPSPLHR